MRSIMQTRAFLKAIPQPVSVVLYAHVMALSERTEWEIFRKGKGDAAFVKSEAARMTSES
jgi:hypothetical protein